MNGAGAVAETCIDEIADGVYRIVTPMAIFRDSMDVCQFLIVDEAPMLIHTGFRRTFSAVREAIERVVPVKNLRHIAVSHFEGDECGALNGFLDMAPRAVPVCGVATKLASLDDYSLRPAQGLMHGEQINLGAHTIRWIDTPDLPHAWDCGMMLELESNTLFCSDLFSMAGTGHPAVTEEDILPETVETARDFGYFPALSEAPSLLRMMATAEPGMMAGMHGSAWKGDGAAMLFHLAETLESSFPAS